MESDYFPSLGSNAAVDRFLVDLYTFHIRGGFTHTFVYYYLYSVKVAFILAVAYVLWPPEARWLLLAFGVFTSGFVAMHVRAWLTTTIRFRYISQVYKHVLHVDVREASWGTVCTAIITAQHESDYWFLHGMGSKIDEPAIRARVLRVDNVVGGLLASEVLPLYPSSYTVKMLKHLVNTTLLDETRSLRRSSGRFRVRCGAYAVGALALMPVVVVYSLVHLVLHMVCSAHDRSSRWVFHRQWSCKARWSLRDVNEYPHTLQFRLRHAGVDGRRYLTICERSLLVETVRHTASFITGALSGLLFVLSNVDDERWVEHHAALLWWFAVVSTCHYVVRMPDAGVGDSSGEEGVTGGAERRSLLRCGKLSQCDWGAAGSRSTYERLRRYMPYQSVEAARTLLELWRLPLRLWQWSRKHAELIRWLEQSLDDDPSGCLLSEANRVAPPSITFDPMTRSFESFVTTF